MAEELTPIKVKYVTVNRAEGRPTVCGKFVFFSIHEANKYFRRNASSFPKMGYDKHDVTVQWEDGEEYSFRLDAQHPENQYYRSNDIDDEILSAIRYWLGQAERKPSDKMLEANQDYVEFLKGLDSGKYEIKEEF